MSDAADAADALISAVLAELQASPLRFTQPRETAIAGCALTQILLAAERAHPDLLEHLKSAAYSLGLSVALADAEIREGLLRVLKSTLNVAAGRSDAISAPSVH